MSLDDYLLDLLLIAVVIRQLRGRKLTAVGLLWPIPLVLWAGVEYLHGIPTSGGDLVLVLGCAVVGVALGLSCGVLTRLHRQVDGAVIATATGAAALLWVIGVGARLAFGLYATHGGGPSIARFSTAHHITSAGTWTAALLLMSLCEVLLRAATLGLRGHRLGQERTRLEGRSEAGTPSPAR